MELESSSDTVNRGNFETRGNFVFLQKRVLPSLNHMAVSYSQCPSKVKVFYKVSSNTDKNKKAFPESFIEFVGTQAGKLKDFGTRPNWVVSYIAYTKFHSPRPVLYSPGQIFTRIGERASASFPVWAL